MLHKVNQAVTKLKFVAVFLFTNKSTNKYDFKRQF